MGDLQLSLLPLNALVIMYYSAGGQRSLLHLLYDHI